MLKSNIPGCQPGIENRQANAKENKFLFIYLLWEMNCVVNILEDENCNCMCNKAEN